MAASFNLVRKYRGVERLKEAAKSPLVRAEIQAELAQIRGIHPERCVVTHEYRTALRKALGERGVK